MERRVKLGIVANEFFDPALGRMGGFGWVAREAGLCFAQDPGLEVDPLFLTGELSGRPGRTEIQSHGIPLLLRQTDRSEYQRGVRARGVDLLLSVDYRPDYDSVFSALPDVPIILWVQAPCPPEDVQKVNALRIPGQEAARPQGITPIDCSGLREVLRRSDSSGRPILFASPAPQLLSKVAGAYGVTVPQLAFLPYILDFDPGPIAKSARPRVVFLGRLDPIKRPWIFVEVARRFPGVEFLLLGQSHFRGEGSWTPGELPANVRPLGHVGGEEKLRLVSSAWALVNTSIHEALPVSFLEALLCEVPIVSCQDPEGLVSRFGYYTGRWDGAGMEAVPHFAEGLARLLEDGERRARLGREGRRWAEEHHGRARFLTAFHRLRELARAGGCPELSGRPLPGEGTRGAGQEPNPWYASRRQAIQELTALAPAGDTLILVDENQWGSDEGIADHNVVPFLERDGQYWGPPPDDGTAVRELERLRGEGAGFIAFAWPAFWWLDHYAGLRQHLRSRHRCLLQNERLIVFDLRGCGAQVQTPTAPDLTRPNDASAWEQVCLTPVSPVKGLCSPVARAVADLTATGDLLLEAGCGSGALSAELATAGRRIELCDFSQAILDRASELFKASGLPVPRSVLCDLTRPLPWPDRAVDVVWSSGVLEHWTDEELVPIVREMARVSRKRVISLVPYSGCVFYRLGKHLAEASGRWPYGREIPRQTLTPVFQMAGLSPIREYTVWNEWGPRLLALSDGRLAERVKAWWDSLPADDPVRQNQGYLLLTVGEVS
jgi:glycosyltransferase involved in cell wall biosynthesis/SAM-dependent methyltransferase